MNAIHKFYGVLYILNLRHRGSFRMYSFWIACRTHGVQW